MKKIKYGLLCALLGAIFSQAKLQAIAVEANAGAALLAPSGHGAYKGQSLDIKSDLNYSQSVFFVGQVRLDVPIIPVISLMATPMKFEGTGTKKTFKVAVQR